MNKAQMLAYLENTQQDLTNLADKIWDFAETAFEEFKSAEVMMQLLRSNGFAVESGVAGIKTAFRATYGTGKPVIGILAEFDALSGLSQVAGSAKQEVRTPGGNGHGCGHNLFAGGSVGAALAVKKYLEENKCSGTVVFYGCPGEEGGSGKAFMARGGCFRELDLALAWHPMGYNAIFDTGMLANYEVLYKFKGRAAHAAAAPHLGRSALDAVELMNVGANFLREHIIPEARLHYAITNSGGFSPNVVQPFAEVLYLIRAPQTAQVEEIYQRVNKIAQGAALMTETELSQQFIKACSNMVPNRILAQLLYENFQQIELPHYTAEEQAFATKISATFTDNGPNAMIVGQIPASERQRVLGSFKGKYLCDIVVPFAKDAPTGLLPGSTDVGDVSWNVPTSQIVTACYAMGTPEHSWQLVAQGRSSVAHKGLLMAAKVLSAAAVDVFENPQLVVAAQEEFKQRLNGQEYHCAIPPEVKPQPISAL